MSDEIVVSAIVHLAPGLPIPEGFKLIAVGERCATPTEIGREIFLTPKGSNLRCDSATLSGSGFFAIDTGGGAKRLPPAIKLNPFGIR